MRGIEAAAPTTPATPPSRLAAVLLGIGIVGLFVLAQFLVAGAIALVGGSIDLSPLGTRDALLLVVLQLGTAALGVLLVLAWCGWSAIALPGRRGDGWRGFLALLPVGLLVLVPGIAIAISEGDAIDPSLTPGRAVAVVVLAFAIGFNEELWFRGLLVARLGAERAPWLTVFASAALFGLPHLSDSSASWLNAAGVMLAIGIPFGVVRMRRRALGPLIAWHGLIDAWAFLHTASITVTGTPTAAEAVGALVLPALLALSYLAWLRRGIRQGLVTP
ncbi:MAG: family intrarane metalloprotease [Thermoleophilia bacterium]|nr:family intrarane metalloprotease [Thermoleophilia bacterium]